MNKKFSTLLAAALVAGGMSVNAQVSYDIKKMYEDLTVNGVYDNSKIQSTRNYVLTDGANVITVENGVAKWVAPGSSSDVLNELWTIDVTSVSGSNRFVLTNKVTGETLSFDPATAVKADAAGVVTVPTSGTALEMASNNTEWTWYAAPDMASGLDAAVELSCAFKTDSTMALATTATGEIYAYKYANAKTPSGMTSLPVVYVGIPMTHEMTADQLNVLTGTNGNYFTLSTSKTGLKDPNSFLAQKYQAVDQASRNGAVWLKVVDATGKQTTTKVDNVDYDMYAAVDSAFHAATGDHKDVLYVLGKTRLTNVLPSASLDFFFTRNLYKDSVMVAINPEGLPTKRSATVNGSDWERVGAGIQNTKTVLSSVLLTADTEVLTLWDENKEENLSFALASPAADNTNTSIADGVYYIKNAKGQYLASPIHKEGVAAWVTVNAAEQNVAHMPAFQWVVLKDKTNDKALATSPVSIYNREFNTTANYTGEQLKVATATGYYTTDFADSDSVLFEAVAAEILADSTIGYKYIKATDLDVNRYTFNYLHAYANDKYIAKSANDSLATVLNGMDLFVIKTSGNFEKYGFDVEAYKTRLSGVKNLYRQAYTAEIPGTKTAYLGVNGEDKYAICDHMTAAEFYFKENNCIEGVHYHALIAADGESKAGVTDDDLSATLKKQPMSEVRTSAFNIAAFDAPLYRRFNSALLEGNEGDLSDTLRFVEKYRGEYLQMEKNANFKVPFVDFLGIYTKDYTADGKSFIVDTAYVHEGRKPLYLISIDREDQAFREGEMCPVCQEIVANGGTRPANCPHDAAGKMAFRFGKFLVSFVDSTDAKYDWKGYDRVGFVKAAQQGDSLYILKDQFAEWTIADFDSAKINKAITDGDYAAANRINLAGLGYDNKHVTWSMRFVNPVVAANEVEEDRAFLFEQSANFAPTSGANWLKMQNGCLVMADSGSEFDQLTAGDDALIFNVEVGSEEDFATENEVIAAEGVTVIAGNGNITIAGAAGKKVVIANILGQTVANTVLTSDNATIAAPAGVVVVKVEGEAAVKAIVK